MNSHVGLFWIHILRPNLGLKERSFRSHGLSNMNGLNIFKMETMPVSPLQKVWDAISKRKGFHRDRIQKLESGCGLKKHDESYVHMAAVALCNEKKLGRNQKLVLVFWYMQIQKTKFG